VRVVPNKYPALAGGHEVILHSPDHAAELEHLGDEDLAEALGMWCRRIDAQLAGGALAAAIFVNRGAGSGASLEHPHAQLIGTPVVPPLLCDELREFEHYESHHGVCVLCKEIEHAGDRLVMRDDLVAWRLPRAASQGALAGTGRPPGGCPGQRSPRVRARAAPHPARGRDRHGRSAAQLLAPHRPADLRGTFHWHVEIAPRLSTFAGFELGCDIGLVGRDPAEVAAAYRDALPSE